MTAAALPARLRAGVAALGGVGVGLVAASTVWPTSTVRVRVPEVGDFTKAREHHLWSWGRQVVSSTEGVVLDAPGGPAPVARLALLVLVLVLAASGLLALGRSGSRRASTAAAVGGALALASVASSVVQRLSLDPRALGLPSAAEPSTTVAGWLEVAGASVLLVVLGLVVAPVLAPTLTAAALARVQRARPAPAEGEDGSPQGALRGPTVGFDDAPR